MSSAAFHSLWPVLLDTMNARFCYLTERLPSGRCLRDSGVIGCLSGWASDTFNTVSGVPCALEDVTSITALYRHYRWPASWWLPAQAPDNVWHWLMQQGWQYAESDTAMVREMSDLPVISPRRGFRVHEVTSAADIQLFGRIISTIFERDAPVEALEVREVYSAMSPPAPGQTHWQLLIGVEKGLPVATASLFVRDGIASINDLATHPAYRRQGIGTAMFEATLQRIYNSGAAWCVLQASEEGQALYSRYGFNMMGAFHVWGLHETDE